MKPLMAIGLILIILGVLALAYQGFTYVTHDRVIDAGPIQVTAERQHYVWVPPVLGGAAIVAGVILMVAGAGRSGPASR